MRAVLAFASFAGLVACNEIPADVALIGCELVPSMVSSEYVATVLQACALQSAVYVAP